MNGIHDMGGMHGFGAIEHAPNEPPLHEKWEGRAGAMVDIMTFPPGFTIDRFRYLRETLRPDLYLTQNYYEQWLYIAEQALLERGYITADELARGRAAPGTVRRDDALRAEAVWSWLHERSPSTRDLSAAPRFATGARVRARNTQPTGHTRLPRYARGKLGTILSHHGAHVLPDTSAHGQGESPQYLYSVRFMARELWGDAANARDSAQLDLWECYLDPA